MGTEVNMAARLCGKAERLTVFVSENIYDTVKSHVNFDMTKPLVLKGRDGESRALRPLNKKVGIIKRKIDRDLENNIFVGRTKEMESLRAAVDKLCTESTGSAFILEGLAGIGKSAIVQQLQRDADELGVRYLVGSGFAIEKETPFYAFSQILCAAADLSPSPTYGEILALRHNYGLDEDELAALGMILPALHRSDIGNPNEQGQHHEAAAAQVCLKIFEKIDNAVFVFEDAHWIDSQTWVLMQMLLQKMKLGSIVLIVTRPPTMESQLRGGGAEGLTGVEEENSDELLGEDDRIKFSRILKALKDSNEVTLLSLGSLSAAATTLLIAASYDTTVDLVSEEVCKIISDRADGVPMYVRSFASWLNEKDFIKRSEEGAISLNGDVGTLKFPDTLIATVLERLDALDENSMKLIKISSCFGFEFTLAELKLVARKYLDQPVDEPLIILAKRLMIIPVQEDRTDTHLKFTHQIICESAYGLMTGNFRQQVHETIATLFDNPVRKTKTEVLAYHMLRAGKKERGCELLFKAANQAHKQGAYKEAYNGMAQAISEAPTDEAKAKYYGFASYIKFFAISECMPVGLICSLTLTTAT